MQLNSGLAQAKTDLAALRDANIAISARLELLEERDLDPGIPGLERSLGDKIENLVPKTVYEVVRNTETHALLRSDLEDLRTELRTLASRTSQAIDNSGDAENSFLNKAQKAETATQAALRRADELLVKIRQIERTTDFAELQDELREQIDRSLESEVFQQAVVEQLRLPQSVVLAFNQETCPDGWKSFDPAVGRFLIGAGEPRNVDENGQQLSTYTLGSNGGEEQHALNIEEMPSHQHSGVGEERDSPWRRTKSSPY